MFAKLKRLFSGVNKEKEIKKREVKTVEKEQITVTVVKDKEPIFLSTHESKSMDHQFPIKENDIIEFRNRKQYKICKRTVTGAINNTSVTLVWINKPPMIEQKDRVEQFKFDSVREINYYLEKEKANIVNIIKSKNTIPETELTVEECHELAIEENKKRDNIKQFFESLNRNTKGESK